MYVPLITFWDNGQSSHQWSLYNNLNKGDLYSYRQMKNDHAIPSID